MCQHHNPNTYSIHDNLVNWFAACAATFVINWVSRQPEMSDHYAFIWGAGAMWGILLVWAAHIGREWMKTWRRAS